MTKEELVSLIRTYGVTEEKAKEIAEKIKDKPFFIGKEIRPKELKGQHTDMVILNDLDDMLNEIALKNKIADMRGEE